MIPEPLVLFSGDAFSPSTHSTITKGQHMVPVLNALGISCASAGNHDFDAGFAQAERLFLQCKFPWLLSNVLDKSTGDPVLGAKLYHIIDHQGIRIGLIGIAERDW